jgi:hypothetical protein
MARLYQLTDDQSRAWDVSGWLSVELADDVIEWAQRYNLYEPVVVVTSDHRIAFALTARGGRA